MSNRYVVTLTPDRRSWVILDWVYWDWCTLPDDPDSAHPNLIPLEWRSRAAAEAWLYRCYQAWQAGTVPAPDGWKPLPPEPSPWA